MSTMTLFSLHGCIALYVPQANVGLGDSQYLANFPNNRAVYAHYAGVSACQTERLNRRHNTAIFTAVASLSGYAFTHRVKWSVIVRNSPRRPGFEWTQDVYRDSVKLGTDVVHLHRLSSAVLSLLPRPTMETVAQPSSNIRAHPRPEKRRLKRSFSCFPHTHVADCLSIVQLPKDMQTQ